MMDTNARVLGYDKKLGSAKRCHFFSGAGGVLVLWSAGHFQSACGAWLQNSTMLTILHARHM